MMAPLLTQQTDAFNVRFAEALTLMGVGMAVVFAALVLLWVGIFIMNRVTDRQSAATAPAAPEPTSPLTGEAQSDDELELTAVLTAAATAVLGQRVRVRRVHFLGGEDRSWAHEGRRLVMTSHQPHLHKRER